MKKKWIILTAGVLVCGISGLIAWLGGPTDEAQIKQEKADKIMSQTYGDDWKRILAANESTNPAQAGAMAAVYETAIGYHRPRNRP
jgi:hypothetical protein